MSHICAKLLASPSSNGFQDPRAVGGLGGRSCPRAGGRQAACPARDTPLAAERGGIDRSPDRGSVERESSRQRAEDRSALRLATAEGARRRFARDSGTWLRAGGRDGPT